MGLIAWGSLHESFGSNNDPKFLRTVRLPFRFEQRQELLIAVYYRTTDSKYVWKHDHLGSVTLTVAKVVTARGRSASEINHNHWSG